MNVAERLRHRFPDAVREIVRHRGETTVRVTRSGLVEVCRWLREEPDLAFRFLANLTTVDYPGRRPRFDVVYHLLSHARHERLRLKVGVSEHDPRLPTLTDLWRSADWCEREVFDLFGLHFDGHPNLVRLLLPDDYEGHPLRKEALEGRDPVPFDLRQAPRQGHAGYRVFPPSTPVERPDEC